MHLNYKDVIFFMVHFIYEVCWTIIVEVSKLIGYLLPTHIRLKRSQNPHCYGHCDLDILRLCYTRVKDQINSKTK